MLFTIAIAARIKAGKNPPILYSVNIKFGTKFTKFFIHHLGSTEEKSGASQDGIFRNKIDLSERFS
jgi:hypothetical protein